ncbi:helix-turn-helix domain-containing protein [Clostridium minihomine]|uniref:helix-turn-helix domain-containing protein n=1 Tax=Clostridium minihomine TaxID=2045012 RepID=UPI000C789166|nr:helix-turn-helix domain-containing protein [Clostridium minihomine]
MARTKYVYDWDNVPVIIDLPYASVLLGSSVDCLKRLSRNGVLPAFKHGGEWRVTKDDLRTYIEENKVKK